MRYQQNSKSLEGQRPPLNAMLTGHCHANIISNLEPNERAANYFDIHAHQLLDPMEVIIYSDH
ncbi:hypothetical protein Q4519_00425 [Motilimonas sp. 1_MG-2023]|uniref:hypothetical protein n=1 Tax=Motilimonas sp. 1_MG-2023 TaxID=3062672 RepID=UPI0026E397F0|nr:hypothetical protein [Motilimonas sp. 1_MG-2023]MDO6524134.1 hypothetical protein [Motilimonas sp. 1_MG-2023]